MSDKDSAQNVISSYRKRQSLAQKAPLIFGLAAVLLIIGAGSLIYWLTNSNQGGIALLASKTPTSTITATVTQTPVPTNTPTVTSTLQPTDTPTPTVTSTAAGPFVYKVLEGDTLDSITKKFGVDLMTILALNPNLKPELIYPGQEIIIPSPDTKLPTATSIPSGFTGTINYTVVSGDSLFTIADKFNSTTDAIIKANTDKLKTIKDTLYVGWVLKIPVNIATRVPTSTQGTKYPTAPIPPTKTPTPTKTS